MTVAKLKLVNCWAGERGGEPNSQSRMASDRSEDWSWFNLFNHNFINYSEFNWIPAKEGEIKSVKSSKSSWGPVIGGGWLKDNGEGVERVDLRKKGKEGRSAVNSDWEAFAASLQQPAKRLKTIIDSPTQYPRHLLALALANLDSEGGVKGGDQGGERVRVAADEGWEGEFVNWIKKKNIFMK